MTRELQDGAPAFRVGQRVKNPWGEVGTVLHVIVSPMVVWAACAFAWTTGGSKTWHTWLQVCIFDDSSAGGI